MRSPHSKSPHQLGEKQSHPANWCGDNAITLIELLIAITLIGFLVYAVVGHDIFTRHQLVGAERRAKLQNEVSYCLEHMAKWISKGIGTYLDSPVTISGNTITVEVDAEDNNGVEDAATISYTFYPLLHLINFTNATITDEVLPQLNPNQGHISNCTFSYSNTTNYVEAEIYACWSPDASDCGTPDNPCVGMKTRIAMPSVSLRR